MQSMNAANLSYEEIDKYLNSIFLKDFERLGLEEISQGLVLSRNQRIKRRSRGGSKLGQLVHLSSENNNYALTYDDITGVPFRALSSRQEADLSTKLGSEVNYIELKMPLVSANMESVTGYDLAVAMARMGGIGIFHQFCAADEQADLVKRIKNTEITSASIDDRNYVPALDSNGRYVVGAALGVKNGKAERAEKLIEAGVDALVVDIAHGHSEQMTSIIQTLKNDYSKIIVIAGNVVSPKAAYDLCVAGADVIKVGVGPGAACTTRVITGFGVPQITGIYECHMIAKEYGVGIMADGGIRSSGDMIKSLAAGASTLMIGRLLAGADESNDFSARIKEKDALDNPINLVYYGSASEKSKKQQGRGAYDTPEGKPVLVSYSGCVYKSLAQFITGMQSGVSYAGKGNTTDGSDFIQRLRDHARWKLQSPSGVLEGSNGNPYMT